MPIKLLFSFNQLQKHKQTQFWLNSANGCMQPFIAVNTLKARLKSLLKTHKIA